MWDKHQIVEEPYDGKLSRTVLKPSRGSDAPAQVNYNLSLSCYVVVEVKIGKFAFADIGQLGGYVVACNHLLRKEGRDNPTIGLLICKEKDRIQAQYALESSSQPLGISEYDLEKFYPEKVEGTMPTIEEIEAKLRDN